VRILPIDLANKIAQTEQTVANKSNPISKIQVVRPKTALENDFF